MKDEKSLEQGQTTYMWSGKEQVFGQADFSATMEL